MKPLIFKDNDSDRVYYESQPKQTEFHYAIRSRGKTGIEDFLFGGAAGPGKSFALRWEGHNQCIHNPRVRGLLLRSSFPELERTQIAKLMFDFPPGIFKYNQQKHTATYFNESVLEFGYGERKEDFASYLSAEYDFILIDELTTIPFELILLLKSRLRTSTPGYVPFLAAATNPGGISHRQVKSYFLDKDFDKEFPELATEYYPKEIQYIHATVFDNPKLLKNDPKYLRRLQRLPIFERKRFLEGSWDIREGQFFGKFSRTMHEIPRFAIPSRWEKVIAMDYGTTTTAIALARDPVKNCVVFGEWTAAPDEETSEKKAKSFEKWLIKNDYMKIPRFADVTLFAEIAEFNGISSYDDFKKLGLKFGKVVKKKGKMGERFRVMCNRVIKNALYYEIDDKNGLNITKPKLYFMEGTCPMLVKTLPELQVDDNDDEEIMECDFDHWYDALKYAYINVGKKVIYEVDEDKREEIKKRMQRYANSMQ